MKYIKVENNIPTDYSIEQLFQDYPDANIYKKSKMPNETLLANYNVYPLITTPVPTAKEDETAEETTPQFKQGEWHQTWITRKLSEEEINIIIQNRLEAEQPEFADIEEFNESFYASTEIQEKRYELCKSCPSFTILKTCKECGCIMPLKIKLSNSACPLEKW